MPAGAEMPKCAPYSLVSLRLSLADPPRIDMPKWRIAAQAVTFGKEVFPVAASVASIFPMGLPIPSHVRAPASAQGAVRIKLHIPSIKFSRYLNTSTPSNQWLGVSICRWGRDGSWGTVARQFDDRPRDGGRSAAVRDRDRAVGL